jgi:peptidoglycan hydrolase-like protein with peptidoglycan-binding domain
MRAVLLSIFLAALVSLVAIPPLASALTFTRPLAFGSSGTDVSALQQYLKDQGYFHYPTLTGYFGPYTWRALAAFQWDNKLEPVGYLGPKSELALNKLLDQSLSSLAPSTPSAPAAPTATSTISLVPTPPAPPIYTTPPPTPAVGQPWQAVSGGGGGGSPAPAPEPAPTPPAPAPYVAQAVHFDGSTFLKNNSLVLPADVTKISVSLWFNINPASVWNVFFVAGTSGDPGNPPNSISLANDNTTSDLFFYAENMGFSQQINSVFDPTTFALGVWNNLILSIDYSGVVPRATMLLNGVDTGTVWGGGLTGSPPPDAGPGTLTLKNFPLWIGLDEFNDITLGDMADVWIAPGVSLFDDNGAIPLSTVRKFISANGKPVDPINFPAGAAVLMSGDASTFGTNQGTGGAFTTTGTLTDAPTSPSN